MVDKAWRYAHPRISYRVCDAHVATSLLQSDTYEERDLNLRSYPHAGKPGQLVVEQ